VHEDLYPFCDQVPDPKVPPDLAPYCRQFRPGLFAYVCPCCNLVFAPGWGGMPGTFRVHVMEYLEGSGCAFKPKGKGGGSSKHNSQAAGF